MRRPPTFVDVVQTVRTVPKRSILKNDENDAHRAGCLNVVSYSWPMAARPEADHARSSTIRSPVVWSVTLATALAVVLGFHDLGHKSLWLDETYSVSIATRSFGEMLKLITGSEINMGLYYVLLRVWHVFGDGATYLRALSVVAYAAAVPAIAVLGTRLMGRARGVLAAFLLAVNPFAVYYAQELRGYSLELLLSILATLALLRWLDRPSGARMAWYVGASTLAVYVHLFGAFMVVAHIATLCFYRRDALRRLVPGLVALAVLLTPFVVIGMTEGRGGTAWITGSSPATIVKVAPDLAGTRPLAVLYGALALVSLGAAWYRSAGTSRLSFEHALVAMWLLIVPLAALAISVVHPLIVERYFIVVLAPLVLLVADGVLRLPTMASAVGAVALVVLSLVRVGEYYEQDLKGGEDWPAAVAAIREHATTGDAIVFDSISARTPYEYFAGTDVAVPQDVALAPGGGFDGKGRRQRPTADVLDHLTEHARVWVLYRHVDGVSDAERAATPTNDLLRRRYRLVSDVPYGGAVQVRLWERVGATG